MTATAVISADGHSVVVTLETAETKHFAFAQMHGFFGSARDAAEDWARKRADIIEMESPRVVPNQLPTEMDLQRHWKGFSNLITDADRAEVAWAIYPGVNLDTRLPMDWVNACLSEGFDPRGKFVWGWMPGLTIGKPLALTVEAQRCLDALS